jgi:hypothetical protein
MLNTHFRNGLILAATLVLGSSISFGQQPQAPANELYHVHIVKAAPGKLPQLIDAYKNGPAPAADEPQVTPIILRHREGSEWDLIVITPLGKQTTITASAPPQAIQDYTLRLQPLTDWHADTFTVGPSWAEVQKAIVPAKDPQAVVYQVSDYRALAGHRPQLRQVLDRNVQDTAGRSVVFAHAEGASWNFLTVTRHDSWAALGAPAPQPQAGAPEAGLALREHMAVHHDTIAVYISGGQAIR